ncbi:MAG: ABC transporter substrate-binding protein [Thermodesulfobacteriota bacterium]
MRKSFMFTGTAVLAMSFAVALISSQALGATAVTPQQAAWLEKANIDRYQPATEDWDAIYEAAKKEGKVVVYSLSSRIFKAVETFKKAYPGVEVEAYDMLTVDQIDKLTREQAAGIHNVDILFMADVTTLVKEILPKRLVWNYVPTTLLGGQKAESVIPADLRGPPLAHSLETKVVFYNFESYPKCPINTLWDLTRPEWRGRVQMKDPLQSVENMNFLQMIVKYADKMAETYKEEFGESIKLSPGSKNAGYEFILRLVKNNLVLTTSDGDASKAVGTPGQTKPPLSLSVSSSKLRDNKTKGLKLAIGWDIRPVVGFTKRNFLVMANLAPHPNAAKLMIRWMLGDQKGGAGMKPWLVPGQWPSRSDVKPVVGKIEDLRKSSWFLDPDWIYNQGLEVRDFWMAR